MAETNVIGANAEHDQREGLRLTHSESPGSYGTSRQRYCG